MQEERGALKQEQAGADRKKTVAMISGCFYNNFIIKRKSQIECNRTG